MAAFPRSLAFAGALALSLAMAGPVLGQATEAPAFVVGANTAYCHASEDSLQVWMNLLVDDGGGVPYYIFGESTTTVPGVGAGVDPVVNQAFETRIPLAPALAQDLTVAGTVTVQAYIGGGQYTAGQAEIGTSLVAGDAVLGSAEAKEHQMAPAAAGETYQAIAWEFEVAEATVPAGTGLEWVISGTVQGGNNVFLACHEARGRSSIQIPVTAASGGADTSGTNSTSDTGSTNSTVSASLTNSTTSLSSTGTNSTTGNATADGSKDSPAPPLAVAGLAVLVAAVAVRRRLR